uniref:Uncharacterized protein n=1 Tax=Eptatretus burgeri TaxID=7764 RepID=A0A8C4QD07_EPTBU
MRLDPGKGKPCERLCLSLEDLENPAAQKRHKIFVEVRASSKISNMLHRSSSILSNSEITASFDNESTFQLAYIDKPGDIKGLNAQGGNSTPSKRVQLERSVLPDGTLLTTVTTRHSRARGNAPCGKLPPHDSLSVPSAQLVRVYRRFTSKQEQVPLIQDEVALSHLYARSMEKYKGEPAAPDASGTPPSTPPPTGPTDSPQATQSTPGSPTPLSKSPPATPSEASESTSRTNGESERSVSPMLPHLACPNSDTVQDGESVREVDTQSLKERRGNGIVLCEFCSHLFPLPTHCFQYCS